MEKQLSIIIPTYQDPQLLSWTLACLEKNTLSKAAYEVLVCDDGSTKDNLSIVKQYEDRLTIRYFYQPDRGFCPGQARNMGIDHAKGQYCLFLDTGILLSTDALAHFLTHAKMHQGAVLGYIEGFSNEPLENIRDLISLEDIDGSILRLEKAGYVDRREVGYQQYGEDLMKWPACWVYFSGGMTLIPRSILTQIGGFDERFTQWGGEDVELGLRLYLAGYPISLCKKAKGIHYPHAKRNQIEDWEGFVANLKTQRQMIYQKFPLPEVYVWANQHLNSDTFNAYLVEKLGLEDWR